MPVHIELVHKGAGMKLRFYRNQSLYQVDGTNRNFSHQATSPILIALCNQSPECLDPVSIVNIIQKLNLGNSIDEPRAIASRAISKIKKELESARCFVPLIKNIRNEGYKISNDWEILDSNTPIPTETNTKLSSLKEIIDICKSHCESIHLITDNSGLMYIDVDEAFVETYFVAAQKILKEIIQTESSVGKNTLLFMLKRESWILLSYISFWRIGEKLTEFEWKADYYSEIEASYDNVAVLIERIRKPSSIN